MSSPSALPDRARWQAFGVCVGVAALTILDLSKVNVGLPSIEDSLRAGPSELQLIVAGYALAFGLALVPSGRLGDMYSRRMMFVIGLSAFTLTSLFCAVAPSVEMLVLARILQGVAAGIQMPQVLGLAQQLFQGAERGRAFGLFGAIIGLSTAFGPAVGGLLIALGGEQDGWRLIFWMNVPLGIAALFFAWRLLPKRELQARRRTELDLVGIALLGIAVFSLMLPFVLTTGRPDDDPARWLWILGFAAALGAFVVWEKRYVRRGMTPVIDFRLLRLHSYRNGILVGSAYFAALPALFLLTTLYLQEGLGILPVFAGMVGIPFALASAVTAWLGGRLVARYGRALVVAGLILVLVGLTVTVLAGVLAPPHASPWLMSAALIIAGAGGGFVISPNQTLTLVQVPVEQGGVAGSVGQVGQRVGTAVGTSVAASVFFATIYAEAGSVAPLTYYHDAYRNGMLVVLAFVATALFVGVIDLLQRKERGTPSV